MPEFEIEFSPEALDDLQQVHAYIAQDRGNRQAAVATVEKILDQIRFLSSFPESGTSLSAIIEIETHYRFLVCGNYVAFYRIEGRVARIVRILHRRRDYIQILFG